MNKNRLLLMSVLLLSAGVVGLIYLLVVPRITLDEFRSQIEADLPTGTERVKVEAWLKARGLSFKPIGTEKTRNVGLSGTIHHTYYCDLGDSQLIFEVFD